MGRPGHVPDDPEEYRRTLAEHLDELRARLIRSGVALVVGSGLGWLLYPPVVELLLGKVKRMAEAAHANVDWRWMGSTAPFMLQLKASMYIGLALALPFVVWELWGFIRPGLRKSEVKPLRAVVPVSMGLFAFGVALGYWIWPTTVMWFIDFARHQSPIGIIQDPYELMVLGLKLMLVSGVACQLPLVVFVMAKVGIVSPDFLWKYWKHCVAGVFIFVTVFSPTADPFSMVALAVPLSILVFGSILAAKLAFGQKQPSELDSLD